MMPTPGPAVTTTEVVQWTARHAAGESIRSIAASTGRAPVTIRRHIAPATVGRGRHITPEQRQAILAQHAAGASVRDIARTLSHTRDTVTRVIIPASGQPKPSWPAPVPPPDRAPEDDPYLPVGTEIILHVTGRIVSTHQGTLTLAVELPDGSTEDITVDLAAAGVSTTTPSLTRHCAWPGCMATYQADASPDAPGWTRISGITVLCPDHHP